MSITQEKRMEVYLSSPEDIQKLYSSEEAASLNGKLMKQYEISGEQIDIFLDVTGDVILGFYKISDMPLLFQQKLGLSPDQSQKMTSQLIEFLSPVVKREEEQAGTKKESLAKLAETFSKPREPQLENVELAKPQEQTENVTPLRTMEGDMTRIHGYGAYNAELAGETSTPEEQNEKE